MDIRAIKKLINLVQETGISEIEVATGDDSIRISQNPTKYAQTQHSMIHTATPQTIIQEQPIASQLKEIPKKPACDESSEDKNTYTLKSPMVGTVYLSSSPDAEPFVKSDQQIKPGDVVCIIEAMKMFNQIETDRAGRIIKRLIENGQPVEHGQPLFIIAE